MAELISEQLANFKEVSKDYASLQQSYHSLKVENEILKSEKGESNDLKQRLKLAATSRKQWRKLRKQMIIEL